MKKSFIVLIVLIIFSCSKTNTDTTTNASPVTISLNTVNNITDSSATVNFTIQNDKSVYITEAGIVYSNTDSLPIIEKNQKLTINSSGKLAGLYTLNLAQLTINAMYNIRVYVIVENKLIYSDIQKFTTFNLPQITVANINANYTDSANINLSITNNNNVIINGIGICYSNTNTQPTILNNLLPITGNFVGNKPIFLNNLTDSTTYYFRTYINYKGAYFYGNVQNFTTLMVPKIMVNQV
ncbi:MAG: hypothetical protein ORN58_01030, partial [Sediminibacterium sp.]|nr:hypothetical protein [Sediminibacterium sp.]